MEGFEHALDAVVVGIDQRVVENDGGGAAVAGEEAGEGEAGEDRQLLAHAAAEAVDVFGLAGAEDAFGEKRVFVEGDGNIVEEEPNQRTELVEDGFQIEIAGRGAGAGEGFFQPV